MSNNAAKLAAAMPKRAGKQECYSIVRKASTSTPLTERELAVLYSYFLPPKPKKIKNVFEWVAYACDDKTRYSFSQFVESKSGTLTAANPACCHIAFTDTIENGFYDVGGGFAGVDVTVMPDCNGAMVDAQSGGVVENFDFNDLNVIDTPAGLAYVMPWNGKTVLKNYLDVVIGSVGDATVFRSADSGAMCVMGQVGETYVCAVIMTVERAGV